jgi:hypothetical protein
MSRLTLQLRRSSVGVAVATVVMVFGFQAVSTAPATAAANAFPREVRGAFPTGTGKGFWLAYANGEVANVGDAPFFGDARYLALTGPVLGGSAVSIFVFWSYTASPCDPVVAIVANRTRQGYRLVTRSGATIARGFGLAGQGTTGTPVTC